MKMTEDMEISKNPLSVMLDAKNISFPLTLRYAAEGDRFVPFGMTGSKLLSDFLTDRKRSLLQKRSQLIVANGDKNILWVVGERIDNRYKVNGETKEIVLINLLEG